jgi:hypothetical protein
MKFTGSFIVMLTLWVHFAPVRAQFYSTGEAPASIRWMEMNSPRFRVIYPRGLGNEATQLVSTLEKTQALTSMSFTKPAKKIPILLHSSSVLSNGYVTWTPARVELVTTPPQDSYAQDWISQLALHEYRHVVQISQLRQGFTSALSVLTGEIAPGLVSATLPSWFYEGDAVLNETVNSPAGRGRDPGFEMPVRTMLLENRIFSYSKALFGSYRDFIPDQYQFGYPMISYSRARYGADIWTEALNYNARHAYLIAPLLFYLGKNYHTTRSGIYLNALDSVKILYNKQEDTITYCKYLSKNSRNTTLYTNYNLPHDLGNGRILVLKSGIGQRTGYVIINKSGQEEKVVTPGMVSGLKSDVQGRWLIWDEITSDPRWNRRDFSEIRLFDLQSNTLRNLTKKTRYFSPDFSPDGNTIAVVETDLNDRNFLTLIGSGTGRPVRRIPAPGNKALQFPEWINNTQLAVITVSPMGKEIVQVDLSTGKWTTILPVTRFHVSELISYKGFILYRCGYNTVENIFAVDRQRGWIYQVTFSRFGASNPAISSDSTELFFADYTGKGANIAYTSMDTGGWKIFPVPSGPEGIWPGTHHGEAAESFEDPVGPLQTDTMAYHKSAHLFHFHSWLPFYTPVTSATSQVSEMPVYAGFMLFSQNLLSTVTSSIGYQFHNGYNYLVPRITWRGVYPVVELTGKAGGPVRSLPLPEGVSLSGSRISSYEYQVLTYVPLVFNRGNMIRYLTPQMEWEHTSTYYYKNNQVRQGLNYVHFRLYMARFLRLSLRDLYSRWGQYVLSAYTVSPGDRGLLGSQISFQAGLYLPGIGAHHHLLLKGGYQKQYTGQYFLPYHPLQFPRGYPESVSKELTTISVDYAFPVWYPDAAIGPVFYIKRFRTDLFHDLSYGSNIVERNGSRFTGSYRSSGMEIMADIYLGRIVIPLSVGVREGYLYDRSRFFTEFLLNIHTNIF